MLVRIAEHEASAEAALTRAQQFEQQAASAEDRLLLVNARFEDARERLRELETELQAAREAAGNAEAAARSAEHRTTMLAAQTSAVRPLMPMSIVSSFSAKPAIRPRSPARRSLKSK